MDGMIAVFGHAKPCTGPGRHFPPKATVHAPANAAGAYWSGLSATSKNWLVGEDLSLGSNEVEIHLRRERVNFLNNSAALGYQGVGSQVKIILAQMTQ